MSDSSIAEPAPSLHVAECGCPIRSAPEIRGDASDTLAEHNAECYGIAEPTHERVFTFGAGQRAYSAGTYDNNPISERKGAGFRLDDRYVVISATGTQTARERMFQIFGPVWSMEYTSREAAGVEEFGLTELVITKDWTVQS